MTKQELKNTFFEVAKKYDFSKAHGGIYKDNHDTWVVLFLQKSNYSNRYYCIYNIYVKGVFDMYRTVSKDMFQCSIGDLGFDEPNWTKEIFNLENNLSDEKRFEQMELFFEKHVSSTYNKVATLEDILDLHKSKSLFLLPLVLLEIQKLKSVKSQPPALQDL